jgi:hypothetical protein
MSKHTAPSPLDTPPQHVANSPCFEESFTLQSGESA